MKRFAVLFILTFTVASSFAQLTFRNQLIYLNREENNERKNYFTDWADLAFQYNWLKLGARYEINTPPDPYIFDKDSLLDENEFTFLYAQFRVKRFDITLGNFYEMFGRGLTLRTYEDRNLRVDNNLLGVNFAYRGRQLRTKVLAGKMRDKYNRRDQWLQGFDGEYRFKSGLNLGANYLIQENDSTADNHLMSGRASYSRDWWDIYTEIAKPKDYDKVSLYAALNLAFEKINVTLEYKNYDSLSFQNGYATEYNAAPSLSREHTFSLLNRHPHQLNQNDEQGIQAELTYTFNDALEFLLNYSNTFSHQNQKLYEEYYLQAHYDLYQKFDVYGAIAWNEDLETQNITPILDASITLSAKDQLHISYQHQHTINTLKIKDVYKSEFDNEFVLLEYSRSPWFSAAVVGEWTNEDQLPLWQEGKKNYWLYSTVSFNLWQNQRLSILYGSRKEGFVCVGGVCRFEPEFNGIEIKLTNRF